MMYPYLRGGGKNVPGFQEQFYGEVNDVISAYNYLCKQPHIDKNKIFLGGHSTGGTLALLVAEATNKFAGVISLGPVGTDYGVEAVPFKVTKKERELRFPINYLNSITTPTWVIEGQHGNSHDLQQLKKTSTNKKIKFISVDQADHFNCIHPVNSLIAKAMLKPGPLKFDEAELKSSFINYWTSRREASDLETLASYRRKGVKLDGFQPLKFYFWAENKASMKSGVDAVTKEGFKHLKRRLHGRQIRVRAHQNCNKWF